MYKQKIGISISETELVELIAKIGFDALSPEWSSNLNLDVFAQKAAECGLELQSLHASFGQVNRLWSSEESSYCSQKNEILTALDACEKYAIPVLVCHTWIGWGNEIDLKDACYDAFDEIIAYAKTKHIQIAFENTEGEQYLFALMERYKDESIVGFCWDSGHEMCYNHSKDLLALYGDRLFMTHLNDNLGIRDFNGATTYIDDLHVLPYDGIADWDYNIERLKKAAPQKILNFELNRISKPDRHENDMYKEMSLERYYTLAYMRACKIAYRYSR